MGGAIMAEVRYYSTKEQLVESVKTLLEEDQAPDIMLSGIWNRTLQEDIIRLIIEKQCCVSCKVLIPKSLFKGDISLNLLRNICRGNGQVRVNNAMNNNLLIIGRYAYILSFSSRLNSLNILTTNFECAIRTDDDEIVSNIKKQLSDTFESSIPFRM